MAGYSVACRGRIGSRWVSNHPSYKQRKEEDTRMATTAEKANGTTEAVSAAIDAELGTSVEVPAEEPAAKKTTKRAVAAKAEKTLAITPPNFQTLEFTIQGTAPYMQARFSEKARAMMMAKHEAGGTAKKGVREARDFNADYEAAKHTNAAGACGIPAAAFRNAMIDACRLVGFPMTRAKCSVFVLADTYDIGDGQPLVYINGEPEPTTMTVRNATGVADIRVRPTWNEWTALVRIRFDADQFTAEEIANLLSRAGMQIGLGEGRPFSKNSNGLGLGTFEIIN